MNIYLTISTFGRYGGLNRPDCLQFLFLGCCNGPERTDF